MFFRLVILSREVVLIDTREPQGEESNSEPRPTMEAGSAHNFERDMYPPSVDDCGGFGFR